MNDLISRQDAIDLVEKLETQRLKGQIELLYAPTIKGLMALPSAQQWIPCSERLPEVGEHYVSEPSIVYCSNGAYGIAELEENFFGQVGWNCERDDEYHEPLGEVVAWMPLPNPWKGENDEHTD